MLFQDPKLTYPLNNPQLTFSHYTQECKKIIAQGRVDLTTDDETIIDANAPFEFRPANSKIKYGALLIHGLFDSPFMMRDLGKRLCEQGLLVRSVLLPGHGTVPGALLNIRYQQWINTVNYGVSTFTNEVEKVWLVGFSTGATLALHHAAQNPAIAGIIMLSPALKMLAPLTPLSWWPPTLSHIWERTNWFCLRKEIDYAKYQSIPFNAVYQLYLLNQEIAQYEPNHWVNCPFFMCVTAQDEVISSQVSLDFFAQTKSTRNRLLIYTDTPKKYDDPRITVRNSTYPENGIVNFSHITLSIAPDNFHYGTAGDYCYASHLDKDKFIYGAFNPGRTALDERFFQYKLIKKRHRRLTFNPDFNFMVEEINRFIKRY